jgi:hypothetical protein
VTWFFLYVSALVVGLMLAGVPLLVRRGRLEHVQGALPLAAHQGTAGAVVRGAGLGLIVAGTAGLAMIGWGFLAPDEILAWAAATGLAVWIATALVLRRRRSDSDAAGVATVIRDIPPGTYGQVRIQIRGTVVTMAAFNEGAATIPAGEVVDVLDSGRSVVRIRGHRSS